jgi:hypothetical protein
MVRTLLGFLAFSEVATKEVGLKVENPGSSTLGLYFAGDISTPNDREMLARDYYYEKLTDTIPPKYMVTHNTHTTHGFIIRSADFLTRIRVHIEASDDKSGKRPYKITFINLSADNENAAVELKHSNSGYVWIDGTQYVSHDTALDHMFEIRDAIRTPVIRLWLVDPSEKGEL